MGRPLFLEGEAGVGKTEIAKVLSEVLERPLFRLQCYDGLDQASALYDWNYQGQMVEIRMAEAQGEKQLHTLSQEIFSERFLIKRPLLQALESDGKGPAVLLIDELDRSDEPFEAFLLELLSDFQVTVPELGTLSANHPPIVIITSNRTREVHDAVKRRCLYHWLDYPDMEREKRILDIKAPGIGERLAAQVVAFVQELRDLDLFKAPGISEAIEWATALQTISQLELNQDGVDSTLGVLLKYQDDIKRIQGTEVSEILRRIEVVHQTVDSGKK
jgi:MoxR-like ATPase|tara:strand:- start:27 stop:848 length:822 start_codon:yes stop_codon:yes gene_type:complete